MLKYLIIYRKPNGEIIEHLNGFPLVREVGEITNLGWEIIEIQVFYNSRFMSLEEYEIETEKNRKKIVKKQKRNHREYLLKRRIKNGIRNITNASKHTKH